MNSDESSTTLDRGAGAKRHYRGDRIRVHQYLLVRIHVVMQRDHLHASSSNMGVENFTPAAAVRGWPILRGFSRRVGGRRKSGQTLRAGPGTPLRPVTYCRYVLLLSKSLNLMSSMGPDLRIT